MPAKKFIIPFASTGDKTAVPNTLQPDGTVSYAQGFGPDYELDKTVDPVNAKDVPRDQTNQLYFDLTSAVGEQQLYGVSLWGADRAPYPINALAYHSNELWRSAVINNSGEPGVAGWEKAYQASPTKVIKITSSGTYTPTPGMRAAFVQVQAGGGGGGGSTGAGAGSAAGSGGSGGGYSEGYFLAAEIGGSQAVTIGSGGAGGANGSSNGTAGTASSFGTLLTATGGSFGGSTGNSTLIVRGAPPDGAGGGSGTTQNGQNGSIGTIFGTTSTAVAGSGGSSRLGLGGVGRNEGSNGFAGQGFGAGGAGAASAAANQVGGAGAPGIVIVTEYF